MIRSRGEFSVELRKVYIHLRLRELIFGTDDEVGIRIGGFGLEFSNLARREDGGRETGCLGRG